MNINGAGNFPEMQNSGLSPEAKNAIRTYYNTVETCFLHEWPHWVAAVYNALMKGDDKPDLSAHPG